MDFKLKILNDLLDKYERSGHFRGENINRSVTKHFDQKTYPDYHSGYAPSINEAAKLLEQAGVLHIEWVRYKTNHLIKRVTLNLEQVSKAYELVKRVPKHDTLQITREKLEILKHDISVDWIQKFIDHSIVEINEKFRIPQIIRVDNTVFDNLILSLRGIHDKGSQEMSERLFSKKYLGNSKFFELHIRKIIIPIARKHLLDEDSKMRDEQVLEVLGIEKSAEELSFCGPLVIELKNRKTDFSNLIYGISIDNRTIRDLQIKELKVNKVITIENKAVFKYMVDKNEPGTILVYIAGFHSPTKRIFLEKIRDYLEEQSTQVKYFHWGDLDYGGIQIFYHLKRNVFNSLLPLNMDVETYKANLSYCESLGGESIELLKKLLKNDAYFEFYPLIQEMINHKLWLEQEALIVKDL